MAQNIFESITKNIRKDALDCTGRLELIDQIRDLLFELETETIVNDAREAAQPEIVFCEECGSVHVSKYGKRGGKQRYRCVDCGKTFTERQSRSMISSSNLNRATWMRFIYCFVDGLTVRKCAANCGVSVNTAYYMRVRLLKLIADSLEPWVLEPGMRAQVDETYFYESFSGNHGKNFSLPRRPLRSGRANAEGGIVSSGCSNGDNVFVVTGINEHGQMFFEVGGRGRMSADECQRILSPKLKKGCHITTDENLSYAPACRALGVGHAAFNSATHKARLNQTNSLHSHMKNFFREKRGVSTRRLSLYLAEFAWRWQVVKRDVMTKLAAERLLRQIAVTDFRTKIKDLRSEKFPFFDWWETDAGKAEAERREIARIQHGINKAREEAAGDPELMSVVDERQEALDARADAAGVEIRSKKKVVNTVRHPGKQMCFSMLRSASV